MGMRINTNVSSLAAQRTLATTTREQESNLMKLSSGSRINRSADDAAGLAISENLKSHIRSAQQAERNAGDGISMIQTAEGGLNEVSSILTRLRELSIQASTDTVGDGDRSFVNLEYQNLKQEIQRISQVTEFNGRKLLDGSSAKYDFQIGIKNDDFEDRISYRTDVTNAGLKSLGLEELTVANSEGARSSLAALDSAITNVSGQRAELGAVQNRLTSTVNNLASLTENLGAANSRIRDTDFAKASADNTRLNILSSAGTSVLGQANNSGGNALKLLG